MQRIFAIAWGTGDLERRRAAFCILERLREHDCAWRAILSRDGLLVLQHAASPDAAACKMHGDVGVVVGALYSSDANSCKRRVGTFTAHDTDCIISSKGRHLLRKFWGQYLAFFADPSQRRLFVLRDPSAAMPCWLTSWSGLTIIFSDVQDCFVAGVTDFRINWTTICAIAAGVALHDGSTTVTEITELRGGELLELHGDRMSTTPSWNPVEVAESDPIVDADEAMALLRQTVTSCVHALSTEHDRIVMSLSGGLDSSIVMSCLASSPARPQVVGVNYYTHAREGDERQYSSLVAQQFGIELLQRRLEGSAVDLRLALSASPTLGAAGYAFELLHGTFEAALAQRLGATAFFQGGGGDGVFLLNGAEHAIADFMTDHGLSFGLIRVAHDIARIKRVSIWSILRSIASKRNRVPHWKKAIVEEMPANFLVSEVVSELKRDPDALFHPLLASAAIPPGKLWHVFISFSPSPVCRTFRQFTRPDAVLPLIAQPVHEVCLRIPTYTMLSGGWDRAIARRAFESDLPGRVVRRRSKGGADQVLRDILLANMAFVRELLLDGVLAREGIVDRAQLERFLCNPIPVESRSINEVMIPLFDAEIFLRVWERATRNVDSAKSSRIRATPVMSGRATASSVA